MAVMTPPAIRPTENIDTAIFALRVRPPTGDTSVHALLKLQTLPERESPLMACVILTCHVRPDWAAETPSR